MSVKHVLLDHFICDKTRVQKDLLFFHYILLITLIYCRYSSSRVLNTLLQTYAITIKLHKNYYIAKL